jgi:hypothetical protein
MTSSNKKAVLFEVNIQGVDIVFEHEFYEGKETLVIMPTPKTLYDTQSESVMHQLFMSYYNEDTADYKGVLYNHWGLEPTKKQVNLSSIEFVRLLVAVLAESHKIAKTIIEQRT